MKITDVKSKEKNSCILVGVDKIVGAFYVIEDGNYNNEYEGTGYYD